MQPSRVRSFSRILVALSLALSACDSEAGPSTPAPTLSTITVTLPAAPLMSGQTGSATATGRDQDGVAIATGTIAWSSSAAGVATIDAEGLITAVAPGTTEITATAGATSGHQTLTVVAPAAIIVNEVESNGGTPGDWIEFHNPTAAPVSLAGWVVKDNDDTHAYTIPAGTTIAAGGYLVVEEAALGYGLGGADAARLFNPYGVLVTSYEWTAHATVTYGRCPDATGPFTQNGVATKGAANDCTVPVVLKITEVESSGGTPGDWIEIHNAGTGAISLAGYVVKDNDDTHNYAIPAGTTLAAGAYYVVEEAAMGFGLGSEDAARLFTATGTLVDTYTWTVHAGVTYGRCPDHTGAFVNTTAATKGAANACPAAGPATFTWPGNAAVTTVDNLNTWTSNLSGLMFEAAAGANPNVLWAALNGPGSLWRLTFNGTVWLPDATNGWAAGKLLSYPGGTGSPDTEGVTYAGTGSAGGLYISAERDNNNNGVSRNSILRFDPSGTATTMVATHEWNLTADLPVTGANLGIEDIAWIPDGYLAAQGFHDEAKGRAYDPADYADHAGGLFFVGLEANGSIYAYALNHTNGTFTRVATIVTGFSGVMGLSFDRELNYLWATIDDSALLDADDGKTAILEIDTGAASPTRGRFGVVRYLSRPVDMPVTNNEGFAITPQSQCVGGFKPVYWSDDNNLAGHSLRRATVPCVRF